MKPTLPSKARASSTSSAFFTLSQSSLHRAATCLLQVMAIALLATLAACSDPGTGGSGVPSSGNATANAADSSGSPAASDFAISGKIDAIDASSVTINGQRYGSSQIDVVLREGSPGSFAALAPGQSVGLNAIANSSPARWTLRILSP